MGEGMAGRKKASALNPGESLIVQREKVLGVDQDFLNAVAENVNDEVPEWREENSKAKDS